MRNSYRDTGHFIAGVILLAGTLISPARAPGQPLPKSVRVVTRVVPPFVTKQDAALSGFSIELWDAIADRLKVKSEYTVKGTVTEILAAVRTNQADMGMAAISITSQRERDFDFSQPFYNAGLQIMVRDQPSGSWSALQAIQDLFSPDVLKLLGLVLVLVLVPAHLLWFVERHREQQGLVETRKYFPGIFKTIWWSTATLATQADEMPKTYIGRVIAAIWMFTSVVFVAYFTAQITTSLTVRQLQSAVKGPSDLPGKRVATIGGTTSETYLKDKNAAVQPFNTIGEAYQALDKGGVDAVVYDAPILLYYSAHEGKGKVAMVGPVFKSEGYGVLFSSGSNLRKPVNEALLGLREDGTYDKLYAKWFGEPDK